MFLMRIETDLVGATPEERLNELNLKLPPVPEAVADYVTHTQIGNIRWSLKTRLTHH